MRTHLEARHSRTLHVHAELVDVPHFKQYNTLDAIPHHIIFFNISSAARDCKILLTE
jgi:hypothetical protein